MRGLAFGLLTITAMSAGSGLAAQNLDARPPTMVFFDWGKDDIQRDYVATLDAVAAAYLGQPDAKVIVEGHSDRSGSHWSNRRSSLRRAEAVRDYLISKGVPEHAIKIAAIGEDQPLIATADGVREPQNRRVDVRIATAQKP